MYGFWLSFHWSLFLRLYLTIFQHWIRLWLGADQPTSHHWLMDVYMPHSASMMTMSWIYQSFSKEYNSIMVMLIFMSICYSGNWVLLWYRLWCHWRKLSSLLGHHQLASTKLTSSWFSTFQYGCMRNSVIRACLFSKSSLARHQEFWSSSICLYEVKRKICSNLLARLVVLLAPGRRAVRNDKPWLFYLYPYESQIMQLTIHQLLSHSNKTI